MEAVIPRRLTLPLALLLLAAFCLSIVRQLRGEWTFNEQYTYGWTVPFLAAYLFWNAWQHRPAPQLPDRREKLILAGIVAVLCLLLFPFRLIEEANPEWRLISWGSTTDFVGLFLCMLFYLGGAPYLKHFAFAASFILVAVPWPSGLEQPVIQGLMRGVAGFTAETITSFGVPAVQQGNLVMIDAGVVGVDEACSGVRSLQTTIMAALFLGELYRLSWLRRGLLFVTGICFALFCNVIRTFTLVWITAKGGFDALHRWHDYAGYTVVICSLAELCIVTWMLRTFWNTKSREAPAASAITPPLWPAKLSVALLVWLLVIEVCTEGWYRAHEARVTANATWSVLWPTQASSYKELKIAEQSRAILRYDTGHGATWRSSNGTQWIVYFTRWEPGGTSAQLAKGHSPDICLPAGGRNLVADLGVSSVQSGNVTLPFREYIFEQGGQPFFGFYCLWEDHTTMGEKRAVEDWGRSSRLQAVLHGRRNLGQQALQVFVFGPHTAETAKEELARQLASFVRA